MAASSFGPYRPVVRRSRAWLLAAAVSVLLSACSVSADTEPDIDERARTARATLIEEGGQDAAGDSGAGESTYSEGGKLIRTDESLVDLGNEMFGDRVSLYNGGLEFVQNDVSVPGNSALPVSVGRRHTVPVSVQYVTGAYNAGQFGDWDLEIPHMHRVFSLAKGWTVDGLTNEDKLKRCSKFGPPPAVSGQQGCSFNPDEYWQGSSSTAATASWAICSRAASKPSWSTPTATCSPCAVMLNATRLRRGWWKT